MKFARILAVLVILLPLYLHAQSYTFTTARGCGRASTTNGNPAQAGWGTPALYSWTWGLDGRFSNISGTADQKNFYNWAKDATRGGEYVLARVHYDINTMYEGRIVNDGGINSSVVCATQGIGIRFLPKTPNVGTEEYIGIFMDYLGSYKVSTSSSATIGGRSVSGKQMGVLRQGSASMTFGVAAYFNISRNINSGTTSVALPTTPTIVSGGYVAGNSLSYYLLAGSYTSFTDALFPAGYDGWGRIGACSAQGSSASCSYGVIPAGFTKPSVSENKAWRFDFVVHKPAGVSFTMPAMKDEMLPYIAIGRLYKFGTNNSTTMAWDSQDQMSVCIASKVAFPLSGASGCGSVTSTSPPPLVPYNPTCYTALRGGTIAAGNTLVTELSDVTFAELTGIASGLRYSQSDATNKRLEIGLECINNNNTIPTNVKLTINEIHTYCANEFPSRNTQGILCNSAVNQAGNLAAKANIQVFRALKSAPNLACSSINALGVTGNSSFQPLQINQTLDTNSLMSSYYSPVGDNNTYLWQFCARYLTNKTTATQVGAGGVKGEFNFTFDYQ